MKSRQSNLTVREVAPGRILAWLALGWRDLTRAPAASLAHGLAIAGFGAFLAWFAYDRFWLLAGAFSGFLVVAPLVATGLYALSRALERGETADFALLARTWTRWGANRRSDPASYWCLVRFGLLLALAGTGWVLVSAAFVTLAAPLPVDSPLDFVRHVVLSRDSLAFEAWLVLGGALAAPMFASSVISMPLLLDRHVNALDAVLASWRVVLANPGVMALWAGTLMLITLLGFATLLAGLILAIPLLGHASWHAYRDLVDATGLPERIAPEARA
ncbi:MAG: DUF2189 domain-containing protein [Burkholderiales bacterium]|nr:DUF2189 domain-containing protein [Burkholderiales bacterium]